MKSVKKKNGNRNKKRILSHEAFFRLWKEKYNKVNFVLFCLQPKESLKATMSLLITVSISGGENGGLGVEEGEV